MKAITILIAILLAGRADAASPSYFDEDSYKQCKKPSYVYEQGACITSSRLTS